MVFKTPVALATEARYSTWCRIRRFLGHKQGHFTLAADLLADCGRTHPCLQNPAPCHPQVAHRKQRQQVGCVLGQPPVLDLGVREGYKEERTALINRMRGLLAEFGLAFAQSPDAFKRALPNVLEDADNELPGIARLVLQQAFGHWRAVEDQMRWWEQRIAEHVRQSVFDQRLATASSNPPKSTRLTRQEVHVGLLGKNAHKIFSPF